jgi:hypothetical protein
MYKNLLLVTALTFVQLLLYNNLLLVIKKKRTIIPVPWRLFICSFIHSFIHSFHSLSYDRSVASYKACSPHSAIWCFLFQFTLSYRFLRSSISSLLLPLLLPVAFISPFIFASLMCFIRQFVLKMWPIHLAYLLFTACTMCLSSLIIRNTSYLTRSVQFIKYWNLWTSSTSP